MERRDDGEPMVPGSRINQDLQIDVYDPANVELLEALKVNPKIRFEDDLFGYKVSGIVMQCACVMMMTMIVVRVARRNTK